LGELLSNLILSIISSAEGLVDKVFDNLIDTCFNAEANLTEILGVQILDFSELKSVILTFSISLIILKFLKKGFDTYILWVEGDQETLPTTYILYFIRALVVALCFSTLYDWIIYVAKDFTNQIMTALNITNQTGLTQNLASVTGIGITSAIFALVGLVMMFILYIQFIVRGIELFVLKLGFPLACVGLLDSDKGVFAVFIKKFFQVALTVVVQIMLVKIAMLLLISTQIINAVAVMFMALKVPKFLQEFTLTASTGTGVAGAIHNTSKTIELGRQIKVMLGR